jgi:uncharacterized protein YcaQ
MTPRSSRWRSTNIGACVSRAIVTGCIGRWKDWHGDRFHGELDRILSHVSDRNGPVSSGEFAGEVGPEKSTGWWDWHPSKTALWNTCGGPASCRRHAARRLSEALRSQSERVIPPEALNARTSRTPAETVDWACAAALDRLGFATSGETRGLLGPGDAGSEAKAWVVDRAARRAHRGSGRHRGLRGRQPAAVGGLARHAIDEAAVAVRAPVRGSGSSARSIRP